MVEQNGSLPVKTQAALLGVSRSSIYRKPTPPTEAELELREKIDRTYTAHPEFGTRRMCAWLGRTEGMPAYSKTDMDVFDILLKHGDPKKACSYAREGIDNAHGKPPSKIVPGTTVYHLVEALAMYLPEDVRPRFIG